MESFRRANETNPGSKTEMNTIYVKMKISSILSVEYKNIKFFIYLENLIIIFVI